MKVPLVKVWQGVGPVRHVHTLPLHRRPVDLEEDHGEELRLVLGPRRLCVRPESQVS